MWQAKRFKVVKQWNGEFGPKVGSVGVELATANVIHFKNAIGWNKDWELDAIKDFVTVIN